MPLLTQCIRDSELIVAAFVISLFHSPPGLVSQKETTAAAVRWATIFIFTGVQTTCFYLALERHISFPLIIAFQEKSPRSENIYLGVFSTRSGIMLAF